MPQTMVRGKQVLDGTIQRDDLDITTTGQAVVAKIVQGTGITLASTGMDSGTGDVTVSVGTPVKLLNQAYVNVTANQSVDCTGATSAMIYISINSAVNVTLTLNNLTIGTPVIVIYSVGASGSGLFKITATTPAAVAYGNVTGIVSGGASADLKNNGTNPTAGNSVSFMANSTTLSGTPVLIGGLIS